MADKKMYRLCVSCGKKVEKISSSGLCYSCIEKNKDEEMFCKIRDFIRENPNATKAQIIFELKIPTSKIDKFIEEYRIEEKIKKNDDNN